MRQGFYFSRIYRLIQSDMRNGGSSLLFHTLHFTDRQDKERSQNIEKHGQVPYPTSLIMPKKVRYSISIKFTRSQKSNKSGVKILETYILI